MDRKIVVLCLLFLIICLVSAINNANTNNNNRAFHYAYRTPIGEESENYLTEDQSSFYEDDYNEEEQDEYVQDYDSEYTENDNGEEEEPVEENVDTLAADVAPAVSAQIPIRPAASQPSVAKSVRPVPSVAPPAPQKSTIVPPAPQRTAPLAPQKTAVPPSPQKSSVVPQKSDNIPLSPQKTTVIPQRTVVPQRTIIPPAPQKTVVPPAPQKTVVPPLPQKSSVVPTSSTASTVVPPKPAIPAQPTHNAEARGPTFCLPTQILTQTTGPNGTVVRSCVDAPPVVSLTCKSYGDPHVTSFSGVQFDFYDDGQYTYVRSANNDFAVFGKLRSWGDGSATTSVTIQMNSKDTYTFDAEKFALYYKTTPVPFNASEAFALHAVHDDSVIYYKPNKRIVFDAKSGAKVLLTFHTNNSTNTSLPNARPTFVNLEIVVPTSMKLKDGFCLSTDHVLKAVPTAEQFKDAAFPIDSVQPTKVNAVQAKWASEDAKKRAKAACGALFKDGSKPFKACVKDFKRTKSEADAQFMAHSTKDFIERKKKFEKRVLNGARFEDKNVKAYNTEKLIDIQKADKEYEELKQQAIAHVTGGVTPKNSTSPAK